MLTHYIQMLEKKIGIKLYSLFPLCRQIDRHRHAYVTSVPIIEVFGEKTVEFTDNEGKDSKRNFEILCMWHGTGHFESLQHQVS